jgi:subtilisin-like proprotein convertase family protein
MGFPPFANPLTGTLGPKTDFANQSATGTWTLRLSDTGTGDSGSLTSWTLKIQCK